jgi:hypothetical protein
METVLKRPRSVASEYVARGKEWTYLNNFTMVDGYVAQCNEIDTIAGADYKPYPVITTNYTFDIPTDAVITSISIVYQDRMLSYETDVDIRYYPKFGKTKFSFVGCDITKTLTGEAPTMNFTQKRLTLKNPTITPEQLNSTEFGVKTEYAYNESKDHVGGIYVSYVKVEVEYEIPRYHVSITEPRHKGTNVTWSTPNDPTIVNIGQECNTTVYFRSLNGYNGGKQTVRINFPINYKYLSIDQELGEIIYYEDKNYVDWVVSPPLDNVGGICRVVGCNIKFTPRSLVNSEMVSATCLNNGVTATYYIMTEGDSTRYVDGVYYSKDRYWGNDVQFLLPQLHRLTPTEEADELRINFIIDVDKEALWSNANLYPFKMQLWSVTNEEYVPFKLVDATSHINSPIDSWSSSADFPVEVYCYDKSNPILYDGQFEVLDLDKYTGTISTQLVVKFHQFEGDAGEYELRVFIPHDDEFQAFDMYYQNIYILHEKYAVAEISTETWYIDTPNVATTVEGGGHAFQCKTAYGFQWHTRMSGSTCTLERRVRHIGGLRLPKSHYEPKLKFSNKVNKGTYKNRAYYNKTGQWEHDLSLNIYLPKFHWRTLMEFVKMDKPVAIDTCPTCDDDDVLNHRGYVEIEDISNVERVNGWWYKGEIGVQRITDKYFGKANIVKGNRVCQARIPYSLLNILDFGDYYLEYFDLIGGGQLIYDKENGIINQIIVPTGEDLHLKSKWVVKDISDYKFEWTSTMPHEATEEYNDYKNNSIVYSIINQHTGETVLTYTLYDFTNTDEVGHLVNTCKVSCTLFNGTDSPLLLFNKQIRLDYDENNPYDYSSTTRLEFNATELSITEYGITGQEVLERNILLPSGEYLIDVAFCNHDVGLLEPDFISTLNIEAKENILANPLSNLYSDMLVSSFVLPDLKLLFYRYSDDGILWYYTGDTTAQYVVDGFQQYKGGVDLQTVNGVSILYIDNYTQTLVLTNGLIKVAFDRTFGLIMFYTYDATTRKFQYVNMLKIADWSIFDIISITDDKAVIQFGETIWTMWRGHPFVQCEHIGVDLIVNDDYDTILSEALATSDGEVIYDGTYGKKENYLYNMIVTPELYVRGTNAPHFVSGDEVRLICYVKNKYGEYLNSTAYVNADEIGKVNFIINDKSSKIDPTPQLDNQNRWYWEYVFTPAYVNDDYQAYARFIPKGEFTDGVSSVVHYNVRKLNAKFSVSGNSSMSTNDVSATITFNLKDGSNHNIAGEEVTIYQDGEAVANVVTNSSGNATYTYPIDGDGQFYFYASLMDSILYEDCTSATFKLTVADANKTDVTLVDAITVGDEGTVTLRFNGVSTGNVKVKINGEEHTFAMNSSKTIHLPKTGQYTYTAEYQGDSTHNRATLHGSVTLVKDDSQTISLSGVYPSANLGGSMDITITGSISNMKYTVYDNGSPIVAGNLSNGTKTFKYTASYLGSHLIKAVYNGDTWREKAVSGTYEIIVSDTTTSLVHSNGSIYQYTQDYVKLLDSNDDPIANKQVKYTINGVTYNKVTDSNGYIEMNINLPPNDYPVHVIFNGDAGHQTSSLDYVLRVKELETVWQPSHLQHGDYQVRTSPYQIWNNLGFDEPSGVGYCTCGYSTNANEVISAKTGQWHTPSKLSLYNFGFDIPSNAQIREIKVRVYDRQYNPRGGAYPNIGNAVITMQGHDPRTCARQPVKANTGYEINEVSWVNPNVTPQALNADTNETGANAFTIGIQYGKNDSNNTGAIMLKYFEVCVRYLLNTVKE